MLEKADQSAGTLLAVVIIAALVLLLWLMFR